MRNLVVVRTRFTILSMFVLSSLLASWPTRALQEEVSPAQKGGAARAEKYARDARLNISQRSELLAHYVPYAVAMYELWKKGCELDGSLRKAFDSDKLSAAQGEEYLKERRAIDVEQRRFVETLIANLGKRLPADKVALIALSEAGSLRTRDCSILSTGKEGR